MRDLGGPDVLRLGRDETRFERAVTEPSSKAGLLSDKASQSSKSI